MSHGVFDVESIGRADYAGLSALVPFLSPNDLNAVPWLY